MKYSGIVFLLLGMYGCFASCRTLKYRKLFWAYPTLWYRRKEGYSKKICYLNSITTIPFALILLYLAFKILFENQ
jgi:hypothetical protein